MKKRNAIELTGVFMEDDKHQITGFFSQFPEAISQGTSFEEAESNLFKVLPDILELKKKMAEEDLPNTESGKTFKKSYSYEFAE